MKKGKDFSFLNKNQVKSLERIKGNESFKNAIELDIDEIAINFKEKVKESRKIHNSNCSHTRGNCIQKCSQCAEMCFLSESQCTRFNRSFKLFIKLYYNIYSNNRNLWLISPNKMEYLKLSNKN